ncbi:MAG: DUF4271 domain-containing protein [Bacteroidales bacterium]
MQKEFSINVGIGIPRPNLITFDVFFTLSLLVFLVSCLIILFFQKRIYVLFLNCFSFNAFFKNAKLARTQHLNAFLFFSIFSLSLFFQQVYNQDVFFVNDTFSDYLFLILSVSFFVYFIFKAFVLLIIAHTVKQKQLFQDIRGSLVFVFTIAGIIVSTFGFCVFLFSKSVQYWMAILLLGFLGVLVLLYIFRTIRLFLHQKNTFFFWILYFCTVEILPLLIVLSLID